MGSLNFLGEGIPYSQIYMPGRVFFGALSSATLGCLVYTQDSLMIERVVPKS